MRAILILAFPPPSLAVRSLVHAATPADQRAALQARFVEAGSGANPSAGGAAAPAGAPRKRADTWHFEEAPLLVL